MLDQNTDRMWYVIGAVIIGAAIVFILNGTMPDLFASVGGAFEDKTEDVTDTIAFADANILLHSNVGNTIPGNGWLIKEYDLAYTDMKDGDMATIVLKGHLAKGRSFFGVYNTYIGSAMTELYPDDFDANGIATKTFKWRNFPDREFNEIVSIYAPMPTVDVPVAGEVNTVEWVKIVKGDYVTKRWTPAPSTFK